MYLTRFVCIPNESWFLVSDRFPTGALGDDSSDRVMETFPVWFGRNWYGKRGVGRMDTKGV